MEERNTALTPAQVTEIYQNEYMPGIYLWGMFTDILGAALSFGPIFVLSFIFGITPSFTMIISAAFARAMTGLFINWFVEPFTFYPIMGLPGLFMTMLSGNTSNLRLPALASAQQGAGVEPGTEQGNLIAIIGIAVSVVISTVMIAIAAIGGTSLMTMLPDKAIAVLNYLLPALFGAIFAQFAVKNWKLGGIALCLAVIGNLISKLPAIASIGGVPIIFKFVGPIFGTMLIARILEGKNIAKEAKQ